MSKQIFYVWRTMHNRCYNQSVKSYPDYGGRGIVVDKTWHGIAGFNKFLNDMGPRPDGGMIERIDNDGPYSPDNCKWATREEQVRNKRNNHWITANGETMIIGDWARRLGCNPCAITYRLKSGMAPEEAVTKPIPERPNAKLNMEQARYIRNQYPMRSMQKIADELNVSKKTVLNILHGKIFKEEP
jgi:hypothetical protein